MAFLTNLNSKDFNTICINYNLPNFKKIIPIYEGIQNSNFIMLGDKKYILTIYEDNNLIKNIDKYMQLLNFINKNSFNCPIPIKNKKNKYTSYYKNKKYGIFTFLKGKYLKRYSNKHLINLGINLAIMHNCTRSSSLKINNYFNKSFYEKNMNKHKKYIINYDRLLIKYFETSLKKYFNINKQKLPYGIIHGDLFPDNVLFFKGKISGFIDFYYACNSYLISDIAIILISWCFNYKEKKIFLNLLKVKNLFIGYNKYRNIKKNELKILNLLCQIYCIRFFFTRLNDKNMGHNPKYIQIKNPNEFLEKYLYFKNNEINFMDII